MEPCIGIASRESGKGIEIQADATLQLRQCCRNQVNTKLLVQFRQHFLPQQEFPMCNFF